MDISYLWNKYKGALIGGLIGCIIAILVAATGLYKLVLVVAVIAFGFWAGNNIQKNKEDIKKSLKEIIEKF